MRALLVVLTFTFVFCGCGKKYSEKEQPKTPQMRFGTTVSDVALSIRDSYPALKPSVQDGKEVQVSSRDWLSLSGRLMESGSLLTGDDRDRLMKAGINLSQAYYDIPESHTTMTALSQPPGNPFVEAAAYFAKPQLSQKWNEAIDGTKAKVAVAASGVKVKLDDLPSDPLPEAVIQKVVDGLKDFRKRLADLRDGNGDAVVDQILQALDSQYVKDLEELRDSSKVNSNIPLSVSMKKLGVSLKKLTEISEQQKQRLLVDVNWGIALAERSEKMYTAKDALKILVDFWLSKDFRVMYPDNLKSVFNGLNDTQILALATENKAPLYEMAEWQRVKARTDLTLMPDREVVAQYVQNNGVLLADRDWQLLKANQVARINSLLKSTPVTKLADLIAVNDVVSGDDERRHILINNWLGLTGRMSFPAELKAAMSLFSDDDLQLLETKNAYLNETFWLAAKGKEKLAVAHHKILLGINSFGAKPGENISIEKGIQNFRIFFQNKIIEATRVRLNNAMWPIAAQLSKKLSDTLYEALDQQHSSGDKVADDSFKIYSRYYMGKLIFGSTDITKGSMDQNNEAQDNSILSNYPLPILEKQNVNLVLSGGRINGVKGENMSSAEVLGVSLTANALRLKTLGSFGSPPPESRPAIALNFESLAKMIALAGYRGYDSNLIDSLNIPMTAGHEGENLDIHNYEPSKVVFATPDKIIIKDQFKIDRASSKDAVVSVRGQMELLRGYVHMLNYYKPWLKSSFDVGLGTLRIDEDPTLKAFDKEDYFLLSLGLSMIVVKNIPLKMLGLITDKDTFVEAASVPDTSNLNVTGAVLSDYNLKGLSHEIKTRDLALGIQAVSEFYQEIKDLEKSTNPVVVEALKAQPLAGCRKDLQKLISGLVLFSTGRLMDKDGGFAPSYDADLKKVSSDPKILDDQLMMEQALLTAGQVLESNFMLAKAADNFFFINANFWNSDLGFYNSKEFTVSKTLKLESVALALSNVSLLAQVLPQAMTQSSNLNSSLSQMSRLKDLWLHSILNAESFAIPAPVQVSEFSL